MPEPSNERSDKFKKALDNAVKVSNDLRDIDLIKRITGNAVLNESNIHSALNSIYVNGKNLTDTLGENSSLEDYAAAVRTALFTNENSFVTIMRRNSIFASPKAVIPQGYEASDENSAVYKNALKSLSYVENYREDVYDIIKNTRRDLEKKGQRDARLFFSNIFYTPEGNLKDPTEDPNAMPDDNLIYTFCKRFDMLTPGLVGSRTPENLVYAYMLTKEYPNPDGTKRKLTYEDLLFDESEEMDRLKEEAGKEFCSIFSKDPNIDNEEKFRSTAYPTFIKMTEIILQQKTDYHDISEKDDIANIVKDESKLNFVNDVFQQIAKVSDLGNIMTVLVSGPTLDKSLVKNRLDYLSSDLYRANDDFARASSTSESVFAAAANAQAIVDTHDPRYIDDMCKGILDVNTAQVLNAEMGIYEIGAADEFLKYKNGMENIYIEEWEKPEHKKAFKTIEKAVERATEKDTDDILAQCIMNGTGSFEPVTNAKDYSDVACLIDLFTLRRMREGENSLNGDYKGTQPGLLCALTGCPSIPTGLSPETDTRLLMSAVNNVYINGVNMADHFHLDENNIAENISECEKQLAGIILSGIEGGKQNIVYAGNGKGTFGAVNISEPLLSMPLRPRNDTPESHAKYESDMAKYNADRAEINSLRGSMKDYNNTANAYAQLLSGTLEDAQLKDCANTLNEKGISIPSVSMSFDKAYEMFTSNNGAGVILSRISGRTLSSEEDYENVAKDIYIGNKPLSELCPRGDMSAIDYIVKMEDMLKDTFDNNIYKNADPLAISTRDKNGNLRSFKIELDSPPVRPKPVEPLKGLKALFASPKTVEEKNRELMKYAEAEEKYINAITTYNRCVKYNETADKSRINQLREERMGPTVTALDINSVQRSRSASPQLGQTPMQSSIDRSTENSGPSMQH